MKQRMFKVQKISETFGVPVATVIEEEKKLLKGRGDER